MKDAEIVACLAQQYAGETFDHSEETAGVYWSIRHGATGGADLVLLRGSVTPQDWLRDFESELGRALPDWPQLGLLPDGFTKGLPQALAAISARLGDGAKLVVAGHSLGAAHASQLAAMLLQRYSIERLVLCGCPRPGTSQLVEVLAGVAVASYRNRSDPVCDVPVTIDPWLSWCPLAPYVALDEVPPAGDSWGLLADHHIELYQAGIAKLEAGNG